MVKLGISYLKPTDITDGDMITFINEGMWAESNKFKKPDGTPTSSFQIEVKLPSGAIKTASLNKKSRENLINFYGNDTKDWIDKEALVNLKTAFIAGQEKEIIIFSPVI